MVARGAAIGRSGGRKQYSLKDHSISIFNSLGFPAHLYIYCTTVKYTVILINVRKKKDGTYRYLHYVFLGLRWVHLKVI